MSTQKKHSGRRVVIWIISLALVMAGFYALDHVVMSLQGLPLNADLTPAG